MSYPPIILIDNVDSFTYNLVDEMRCMGFDLTVYRNTQSAEFIEQQLNNSAIPPILMLSPGPGAPADAGCVPELLNKVGGRFAVLGICLGHQAIVEHYGGTVGRAETVMHGKASAIEHDGQSPFENLPNPLMVARYHSLVAHTVPDELRVLARYQGLPMAVYHQAHRMLGFQFHPESILTSMGSQILTQSIAFLGESKCKTS